MIAVLDVATGVTSTATGDDAIVTVDRDAPTPRAAADQPHARQGESFRLRAVGYFAGGYTRSIANRVVYASSDPSVGNPTNDVVPSEHARVLAIAEGTAISRRPTRSPASPRRPRATTSRSPSYRRSNAATILNTGPIALILDH